MHTVHKQCTLEKILNSSTDINEIKNEFEKHPTCVLFEQDYPNWAKRIKRFGETFGLWENFTGHDMRRLYSKTIYVCGHGKNLSVAQKALRHTNIKTTELYVGTEELSVPC